MLASALCREAIVKKLAIIVAVAGLIATPAFAADMAVKAPPPVPAPVYNWTGLYIGGNFGGGWSADPNVNFASAAGDLATFLGVPNTASFKMSGPIGGFQAGYNYQFSPTWVAGFEADFDFSSIAGSSTTTQTAVARAIPSFRPQTRKCNGSAPCAVVSAICQPTTS
jgi:outer membrane immunogenic protein